MVDGATRAIFVLILLRVVNVGTDLIQGVGVVGGPKPLLSVDWLMLGLDPMPEYLHIDPFYALCIKALVSVILGQVPSEGERISENHLPTAGTCRLPGVMQIIVSSS